MVPITKPVMESVKKQQRTDLNAAVTAWLNAGNVIEPAVECEPVPRRAR